MKSGPNSVDIITSLRVSISDLIQSSYKGPDMSNRNVPSTKRRLGYELKRAQQALRNRMDAVLRPLGLTTAQYAVLCALEREDGASNANLAKAAFVTAQTMHGILTNMERGGLIKRIDDPTHGKILK